MAEFSDERSGAYCMCTRDICSDECRTYRRFHPKPKNNAEKIRAMTDEELAKYMGDVQTWGGCPNHGARNCTENCADCWLDWLKQEVTTNSAT